MSSRSKPLLEWGRACDAPAASVVAELARAWLRDLDTDLSAELRLAADLDDHLEAPADRGAPDPHRLGALYEALIVDERRRVAGMHYTPPWLATGLVGLTGIDGSTVAVLDPAVGGGAFLLAAADALVAAGLEPTDVLARLTGVDIDAGAVAVSEAALALWAADQGVDVGPAHGIVAGDALVDPWPSGSEVVVGNPPFLTPLRTATRRDRATVDRIAEATGVRPGPYTDTAALFLSRAVEEVAPGGRVCLVLPTSVATARDSDEIRRRVARRGTVQTVWRDDGSAFAASVTTFAPMIEIAGTARGSVAAVDGTDFADVHSVPSSESAPGRSADDSGWSQLLGGGAAPLSVATTGEVIGDRATVTAGFRDEFYGVAAATIEASSSDVDDPRVITSGLIDVGGHGWGDRPARIAKRRWQRPVAPVAGLREAEGRVGEWCQARLVPKVLVATQTKVVEPAIDWNGDLLPLTPVVSVEPDAIDDLALLAAVLLAPPISRFIVERRRGSGMSASAVRLSARDIAALPLPRYETPWNEAAELVEHHRGEQRLSPGSLDEVAGLMTDAYGSDADTLAWWNDRRKPMAP